MRKPWWHRDPETTTGDGQPWAEEAIRTYRRLKTYRARIEAALAAGDETTDWDELAREHLVQISFFQHERLIHLLVTLAFALMELGCALATVLAPTMFTAALSLLLLVLLVPYVVHYYHLENGVQALYEQYDRMLERCRAIRTGA